MKDVDHPGVPNTILVKEKADVALRFGEKSAAEQNSVYIAWEMLMEPKYQTLRACIYSNDNERKRFRQLLVNAVMATDIMDQDLQLVRRNRWGIAFNQYQKGDVSVSNYERSRKATSVIEHIIQASDVAHTMQHWHCI
jgi:3'5'-cyclic nucleotide phosphodiesterase